MFRSNQSLSLLSYNFATLHSYSLFDLVLVRLWVKRFD